MTALVVFDFINTIRVASRAMRILNQLSAGSHGFVCIGLGLIGFTNGNPQAELQSWEVGTERVQGLGVLGLPPIQ